MKAQAKEVLTDPSQEKISPDETLQAIRAHLLGLFSLGLAPLLLLRRYRGRSLFVTFHALQSLILAVPLILSILVARRFPAPLNNVYAIATTLMWCFVALVAASSANQGRWFNLPLTGRLARKWLKIAPPSPSESSDIFTP